jgi:Homeodomain-like domain
MMRAGITVKVTPDDRRRLEAIVSDRNAPQKHVWRAKIIFATADGCGTSEIMRRSGKAKPVVWRWQARFMAEGVEGLTRDKTRKPGEPPLPAATVQRVVDLALSAPPGEASHWTGRMLAKAAGVSLRSVQRILEAHQLAPHRIRTFKLSNDPKFAEKLKDIVGLYVDPPAHAVVLSVDDKEPNPGARRASSDPSAISRPPSTASSWKPMPNQNLSSGPQIPTASPPLSNAGNKR